ncbi:MAG: hypothetical protein N3A59_05305 [Thermodesulfovibrionales bacterium]|nr:hypothetical protein [Thermodesulfovibrionales bacterium]
MIVEDTILIKANLDVEWTTFTDLTCWKDWNNVIKNIISEDKYIVTGSCFYCNFIPFFFPIRLKVDIKEVKYKHKVVWCTNSLGMFAEHTFLFKDTSEGVVVRSSEIFYGYLVEWAKFLLPKKRLYFLTKKFLNELKKASEAKL